MRTKKIREKDIQHKVVSYAKQRGFRPFKRTTLGPYGTTGDPDYEFNGLGRHTFFIEFKAPGKTSTPKQVQAQEELQALGYHVYECDNVADGEAIIDAELEEQRSAAQRSCEGL